MNEYLDQYMATIDDIRDMCREIDEALHEADPDNIRTWDVGRAQEIKRRMQKVMKYIEETRAL